MLNKATEYSDCIDFPDQCPLDIRQSGKIVYCDACMEVVNVDGDNPIFYVSVGDESPSTLTYQWFLDGHGILTNAVTYPNGGSQIDLAGLENLNEATLTVQITDDHGHQVELTWYLEELE